METKGILQERKPHNMPHEQIHINIFRNTWNSDPTIYKKDNNITIK